MEWPSIWFGAVFRHEVEDKAHLVKEIEQVLNDKLDLSRYGAGLQSIRFVPLALQPGDRIHEEEIKYAPRKKELTLKLKLDYDSVLHADKPAMLRLIALLFLNAIERYPAAQVRNFDSRLFGRDVARVFESKGLVYPQES